MKRPIALAAASTALLLPLTACGGNASQDYGQRSQAVCMDPITEQRYDDDYCDLDSDDDGISASTAFLWAYMLYGSRVPAVGSSLHGSSYSRTAPKSYVRGGAPYYGGKVSQSSLREGTPVGFDAPKPSPGRTATPKPSASTKAATPAPSASASAPAKTLAPAAPTPKATKKSWLSGLSGKACGKFSSRSSGGSKSWSSGNKSTSKGSSGKSSTSGGSSSKKTTC